MNKFTHVCLLALIFFSMPASADPKAGALGAVRSWIDAVNRNDLTGIVDNFASDASFFGTTTTTMVNSPDGIRQYFEGVYAKYAPVSVELGEVTVSVLSKDSAVVTGYDQWKVTVGGRPFGGIGRLSIAVSLRDGQWKIISFHRSMMPN